MIKRWGRPYIDTIVVDNGSDESERMRLRSLEPGLRKLFLNDRNLGYAGGNNVGLRYACDSGYENVLLLNNDAASDGASIDIIHRTLEEHPESSVVGPVIYDRTFRHIINAGGLNIADNSRTHRRTLPDSPGPYVVDYVSGTVLLARTELFKMHGLLDEDYFFSGEIADLCHRSGAVCMIHPGARASHDTRKSDQHRSTLYTYYSVRNRYLYIRKNLYESRWKYYPFWWKVHARHARSALGAGRMQEARMVLRGVLDGMYNRTGALDEAGRGGIQ